MSITLGRRTFLKTMAVAGGATLVNPLGLLKPQAAFGSIPTGDYLNERDPSRFWFRKIATDVSDISQSATLKPIESEDGQLSLRIGAAGGFAIGFFSTINFLTRYKQTQPDDYIDLISNAARTPDSPNRVRHVLRMLETHRRTAIVSNTISGASLRERTDSSYTGSIQANSNEAASVDYSSSFSSSSFCNPLENVSCASILSNTKKRKVSSESIAAFASTIGEDAESTTVVSVEVPTQWEDAQLLVQKELSDEFYSYSNGWDDRLNAVDASRLLQYENGKLKLDWIDDTLLALEFQTGVERGRMAALANSAFSDIAALTQVEEELILSSEVKLTEEQVSGISNKINKLRIADDLSKCFGQDVFWRYAFDSAPFRPAVRLKMICGVDTLDVGARFIEMITPFLPFDATRPMSGQDKMIDDKANQEISKVISESFGDPSTSRWEMPRVTTSFPQAQFEPCREMIRHTVRLLESVNQKNQDIFGKSSLQSVTVVPEVTSPWTFAGVSAAFCNTYLIALQENQLNTPQSRGQYRRNVSMTVDSLLKQSVGRSLADRNSSGTTFVDSSPVSPALVQYASGYRAATPFSDRVTDQVAQAEGARKVYKNLQIAMPEYFTELPSDKFLTADDIAGKVLVVAKGVYSEIDLLRKEVSRLRIENEQLRSTIVSYQKFFKEFSETISNVQSQLSVVKSQEDLKRFQESSQQLLSRLNSAADDSQKSMVGSLQGLLNTFVVVSNTITMNATVELKAKVQINMCSVGNQK